MENNNQAVEIEIVEQVGEDTNDSLIGNAEIDIIDGLAGKDYLFGDVGDDWLFGSAGNDTVEGGAGIDIIAGGNGKDRLIGSEFKGNYADYPELQDDPFAFADEPVSDVIETDFYFGGAGADTFVMGDYFNAHYRGDSLAVVYDFNETQNDRLEVFGEIEDYSLGAGDLTEDGIDDLVLEYQGDAIALLINPTGTVAPADLIFAQEV